MGTGTSSGIGPASAGRGAQTTSLSKNDIAKAIAQAKFTNEGNGNWQVDIPGVGGAIILDETGGSKDPMYGMGGKVYSIRTWDQDYTVGDEQIFQGSINQAKTAAKKRLKGMHNA